MSDYPIGIRRADTLVCEIGEHDWEFPRTQGPEVDRHWAKLCAARPSLFDGPIFLMHNWSWEKAGQGEPVFRSLHFETGFKNFIAWRDFGFPDRSIKNCFSMAALRGADGSWIMAQMGDHTANAGRIYFPAGTPDRKDVRNGDLDLEASACRELAEETGLDPAEFRIAEGWTLVDAGPRLACMKVFQSNEAGDVLAQRINAHIASDCHAELARAICVRSRSDIDMQRMPDFIVAFLRAELPPE